MLTYVDSMGNTNSDSIISITPNWGNSVDNFCLFSNYPNPFNSYTKIPYHLRENVHVKISIYNLLGQEIIKLVDADQEQGYYEVIWDGKNKMGKNVGSNIYIINMLLKHNFSLSQKIHFIQ